MIYDSDLSFGINRERRDRDLFSLVNTKVVLCSENKHDINIDFLHQDYRNLNLVGLPYHFIVKESGDVFFGLNRAYVNGLYYGMENPLRNAICILIEGMENEDFTTLQRVSLAELIAMVILQDNIIMPNVTSQRKLKTGYDDRLSDMFDIAANICKRYDRFRTVGDFDPNKPFYKIVTNETTTSRNIIMKNTGIEEEILISMNPHLEEFGETLPPGQTVFLPPNRLSNYSDAIEDAIYSMNLCNTITDDIMAFEELRESYGGDQ